MVSFDDRAVPCTICNPTPNATKKKCILIIRSSYTVSKLFNDIKTQMDVDNFEVQLETPRSAGQITLRESDKTLKEVGIDFNSQQKLMLTLVPVPVPVPMSVPVPMIVPTLDQAEVDGKAETQEPDQAPAPSTHRRKAIFENAPDSTVPDDMDLALGASASPIEPEAPVSVLPLFSDEPTSSTSDNSQSYPCK